MRRLPFDLNLKRPTLLTLGIPQRTSNHIADLQLMGLDCTRFDDTDSGIPVRPFTGRARCEHDSTWLLEDFRA